MKVTKATRWRVFAGVWLQSLFTSATAFFSLFCIPLTTQFGWSDSDFALLTPFTCSFTALWASSAVPWRKD